MFASALVLVAACTTPKPLADPEASTSSAVPARVEVVTETLHGVAVDDPYRWLENAADPEVVAFVEAQNALSERTLAGYPVRETLRTELTAILGAQRISHGAIELAGGRIFALRRQPPKRQRFLVELTDLAYDADARTILDPEKVDPEGLTTIDWYVPSPDGTKVAVSLSRAGTESGDVYVVDVATGERVEPPLPRVNGGTAGGALDWDADSKGFLYTRYPRDGERAAEDMAFYVQLWHHTLGDDPAADRYEIGEDFPRIAEIDVEAHPSGRVLVTVQDGDGGEFAHWLRERDGSYRQLSSFGDGTVMMTFSENGDFIYAVAFDGTPTGRIIGFPVGADLTKAESIVTAKDDEFVVTSFWSSPSVIEVGGRLLYEVQRGGPSELRVRTKGAVTPGPAPFAVGAIGTLLRANDGHVLFSARSYVDPTTWFRWNPETDALTPKALNAPPPVDFDGVTVKREFATSLDGTQVPVNLLLPEGVDLDGDNPCVVTGYGGYGISLGPYFRASYAPLLDRGVIVAQTNLRGGSEFGETWHQQGMLENKQNVFDDFTAVLEHLVARGYARPGRIGIIGGSNGGLLMGAVLTQHPEAMAAVVASVGIFDMIRVENSPNGAFNVTEFGTVQNERQFRALYGYSPYHHVEDSKDYPPVLLTTGANDPRVDPMQSRKMAARLQAAQSADAPILLRTDGQAGHGGGAPLDARIALQADQYAFLLHHIGAPVTP